MFTLNQIVRKFKAFQEAHRQLSNGSFHYGYLDDVLKAKEVSFPVMVVTPRPKSVGQLDAFNFEIFIADLMKPSREGIIGLSNELEVQSDMDLIVKDFIVFFQNNFSGLTINLPVTAEDFSAGGNSKECAGWVVPVSIEQYNDTDYCAIPMDEVPDSPYATVQFDGIIDSGPPYEYTLIDPGN